jgi:hypothetical protein
MHNYREYILEKSYVDEFTRLYGLAPKSLQQEVDNTKGVKQSVEWHPEGDVYVHSRLVTNRLANTYHDTDLNLAGFFHDLGKTTVTVPNDRGGFSAHGHEDESVKIVEQYGEWIKQQGGKVDIVKYIVENHMRIKYLEEMRLQEVIRFMNEPLFPYLEKFQSADIGGTSLECDKIPDYKEIKQKIDEFETREKENKIISKKFNGGMIMDKYPELRGEKLGIALSNFKKQHEDFRKYVLDNTTEDILKAFDNFMMTVNEGVRDKMEPKTDKELDEVFKQMSCNVKEEDLPMCKLIFGCESGLMKYVEEAVKGGANIHITDDLPLQIASANGNIEVVKYLLDKGVTKNINTAMNLAAIKGHRDIALLLLDYINK